MFAFQDLKVKWKIILPYTLMVFLIVGFIVSWYVVYEADRMEAQQLQKMDIVIQELAEASSHPLAIRQYDRLRNLLTHLVDIDPDVRYVSLVNSAGICIVCSDKSLEGKLLTHAGYMQAEDLPSGVLHYEAADNGTNYQLKAPIKLFNVIMGELYIGISRGGIHDTVRRFIFISILIALATAIAGIIIFNLIIQYGVNNPIQELNRVSREISSGNLEERMLYSSRDELGELADAFNNMTSRLGDTMKGLNEEIAERSRAEEALRTSRQLLEAIIDNSTAVIYVKDTQGRFMLVNRHFEKLFNITKTGSIGKTDHDLFPKDLADKFRANDLKVAASGTVLISEEAAPHEDGLHTYISIKAPLYGEDAAIYAVCGISTDITDLKQVENELKDYRDHLEELVDKRTVDLEAAKERAEESDRLKSAFLATMSHELRTPMNSIIGFTGIMLQGLSGPLNDEQKEQLSMVKNSADHLLNIINDLLDISRIESGQLKISAESFNIHESINKVVQTIAPLAEKKGLSLIFEEAPDIGEVVSDRRRVEQIILNLVNNAIKFTEIGEVRIKCKVSNGYLITSVKDTGIGIKPADIDKLFKPFQQIDMGLDRKREGTGLGLSICKKLAGLLGGDIKVESKVGEGSTFTLTLQLEYKR